MKRFLSTSGLSLKKWSVLGLLVIGVLWSGSGAYTMYTRYSQSKDEYERSKLELARLEAREVELQANISNLQTSRGVEGEVRTRFNAAKNGEELILVVEGKNSTTTGDGVATSQTWWQKFKNLFK